MACVVGHDLLRWVDSAPRPAPMPLQIWGINLSFNLAAQRTPPCMPSPAAGQVEHQLYCNAQSTFACKHASHALYTPTDPLLLMRMPDTHIPGCGEGHVGVNDVGGQALVIAGQAAAAGRRAQAGARRAQTVPTWVAPCNTCTMPAKIYNSQRLRATRHVLAVVATAAAPSACTSRVHK